jgi:hypothetical protein
MKTGSGTRWYAYQPIVRVVFEAAERALLSMEQNVVVRVPSCTSKAAVDSGRPLWVLLPNGTPIPVTSLDAAPTRVTCWCREGDSAWQPLTTGPGNDSDRPHQAQFGRNSLECLSQ